jgi:hypothetical protein
MDEKGYDQLYDVMKYWNKEIHGLSGITSKSFSEIDNLIERIDGF